MTYRVKEVFDTIQGEGGRSGMRSVFVRLAGCNLWNGDTDKREGPGACAAWCDTEFRGGVKMTAPQVVQACDRLWPLSDKHSRWVVLSGGEPLLQVDTPLIEAFHEVGWSVQVETNGTRAAPPGLDWITCSPKLDDAGVPLPLMLGGASEVKVVLPGHSDPKLDWNDHDILCVAASLHPHLRFVQPMDTRPLGRERGSDLDAVDARCLAFVREHPEWRLSVQLHKVLGLP